jgi:hypothetical protein
MKILYILQQSVFNNKGKWISADSNINMMVGMIESLKDNLEFWNKLECIDIIISNLEDFEDIHSYSELIDDEKVNFISYNFFVDSVINRQHFDAHFWTKILNNNYDIVINNITELSRNIKTILSYKKLKSKLITQCFWMDTPHINEAKVPIEYSYDWRQIDGYECSDLCTFTCQSTKKAFMDNLFNKFDNISLLNKIENKSTIWDFGYSQKEANKHKGIKYVNNKKLILFLNRLSGINYTHYLEFIEALKILKEKYQRNDFSVMFTNPSGKISVEWLQENVPNYISLEKSLNREEYWKLLYRGNISVHLYTIERYSGCALRESIAAGNMPVVAKCFEQQYLVPNDNLLIPVQEDKSIKAEDIAKSLLYALDNVYIQTMEYVKDQNYYKSSFESVSNKVIEDINKLL